MPTLPNMGLITPTLGGDSGTWDDKINACFEKLDAHDHTPGKGLQVPVAGLDINADLPLGGHAIDNAAALGFVAVDPAAGAKRLYVSSVDNELYWQAADGTSVKLTSGSTVNVSLVGGIGGDYAAVGAQIAYGDADAVYTLQDGQSPKRWARLATGPVRIHEFNTTESVYVELLAPTALAASYSVTWPTAAPSSKLAMQMAADGTISLSNAFEGDAAFSGAITASDFNHGERTLWRGMYPYEKLTNGVESTTNGYRQVVFNADNYTYYSDAIPLPVGTRLTGIKTRGGYTGGASGTVTFQIMLVRGGALVGSGAFVSVPYSSGSSNLSGTFGTPYKLQDNEWALLAITGDTQALTLAGVGLVYDRPTA